MPVPVSSMHPELASLLREARRRPEDDPARLVLADWLEENGDEGDRQWADLIRTESRLGWLHPDDPERRPLAARAEKLRRARPGWSGPLVGGGPGLLQVRPAVGLCRLAPRPFEPCTATTWATLARHPIWPFVDGFHLLRALDNPRWKLAYREALRDLLAGPIADGRGFLGLEDAIDEDVALDLAESPGAGQVTALDLTGSGLDRLFLRPLLTSPHLKGLAWLALGDCHLTEPLAALLAASPYLGALRHLELCNNDLGATGAERLGHGRARPRSLGLALNNLRSAGVEALLTTPLAPALRSLDLGGNGIGDRGAVILATAPQLIGLQRLFLDRNGIGAAGARALADSPYLSGLTYLYINLGALPRTEQLRLRHRYGDRVR